ncbi:NAD-dependent succinate-semialdehyde dehydrogenase [Siminovitchia terrae]|uniref:NAD-dependent succinate-semialdehyde dehydrogenase n=1 Tax=Siminovitchia terrae TaxID=1914933 RepID=A0A429XE44_SIMTE|nr:NAD-dependent succinate-semialdehyde dehydrogenase [Siminovitchia terrae]RST61727.1 NAD-dependent succinate-semialdehyde dehydrogenase [Siminovitchia terrae]
MFINGNWITDGIGKIVVKNPSNGETVGTVPKVGIEQVEEAIEAASKAFKTWSKLPAIERSNYLYRIAALMTEQKEELARTGTLEMGKAIADMRAEVQQAIEYVQWYAEEARRVYGETIPTDAPNKRVQVLKQPIGVVGAITPWNFPVSMITRKISPAIAAGCTVVLKPASQSPLSAKLIFEIFEQAGLPAGVVNLVAGNSNDISATLLNSKNVKKLSFTGSTEVGKMLMAQGAETVKKLSLELGGHAPFIVFEDADIDLAVDGLIAGKFSCAGQVCVAMNRLYVHQSVVDEFAEKLVEKTKQLKIGDGLDPETNVGPLVSEKGVEKSEKHVQDAIGKGAELLIGGKRPDKSKYTGSFFEPTVLKGVNDSMIISYEETFGPVAPIIAFETEEDVLKKANNTEYGLAAYFYTNNLSRVHRVSEELEYGIIGVNDTLPITVAVPFGGIKESGNGKEGGHHGIREYLVEKMISTRIEL